MKQAEIMYSHFGVRWRGGAEATQNLTFSAPVCCDNQDLKLKGDPTHTCVTGLQEPTVAVADPTNMGSAEVLSYQLERKAKKNAVASTRGLRIFPTCLAKNRACPAPGPARPRWAGPGEAKGQARTLTNELLIQR